MTTLVFAAMPAPKALEGTAVRFVYILISKREATLKKGSRAVQTFQRDGRRGFCCGSCSKEHFFGVYVAAHANEPLQHTCDCGAQHTVLRYRVTLDKRGKRQPQSATAEKVALP